MNINQKLHFSELHSDKGSKTSPRDKPSPLDLGITEERNFKQKTGMKNPKKKN